MTRNPSRQVTSGRMRTTDQKGEASAARAGAPFDDDRLVFVLAAPGVAAHQIQSWISEPEERNFRVAYLTLTGLTALSTLFLPRRARGALAIAVGVPPVGAP